MALLMTRTLIIMQHIPGAFLIWKFLENTKQGFLLPASNCTFLRPDGGANSIPCLLYILCVSFFGCCRRSPEFSLLFGDPIESLDRKFHP
jgi:hypothetical protein